MTTEQSNLSGFYGRLDSTKTVSAMVTQADDTPKPPNHLEAAKVAALNANQRPRPIDPADELAYAIMHALIALADAATRIAECQEQRFEDAAARDTLSESVRLYQPSSATMSTGSAS